MTEDERNNKIRQFREKARHGRDDQATGGTGESPDGDTTTLHEPGGTTFQATRGLDQQITPTGGITHESGRAVRDSNSRTGGKRGGSRRSGGRHGESSFGTAGSGDAPDSGAGEDSGTKRAVGNLVAEGETLRVNKPDATFTEAGQANGSVSAPTRHYKDDFKESHRSGKRVYVDQAGTVISPDDYKSLKTRSESVVDDEKIAQHTPTSDDQASKKSTVFSKGPLTEREAKELYEPFTAALPDVGHYIDQGLWMMNPAEDGRDIWGEMSRPEAEMIAEALLSLGQRNVYVAVGIRETVYLKKYAAIAAFVIPRAKKTYKLVRTAPKRQRRPLRLFRNEEAPA